MISRVRTQIQAEAKRNMWAKFRQKLNFGAFLNDTLHFYNFRYLRDFFQTCLLNNTFGGECRQDSYHFTHLMNSETQRFRDFK